MDVVFRVFVSAEINSHTQFYPPPFQPFYLSQKPKSTTAAEATHDINPDLQVDAHLNKVCPATEGIYNDSFYSSQNVVVTALDNVEARRYVDRFAKTSLHCKGE